MSKTQTDNVVVLTNARRKAKKSERQKSNTLCREGHHKWQIKKEQVFDVMQGKLITVFRCERCGKEKNKAL